jgi:hypothetical protein
VAGSGEAARVETIFFLKEVEIFESMVRWAFETELERVQYRGQKTVRRRAV